MYIDIPLTNKVVNGEMKAVNIKANITFFAQRVSQVVNHVERTNDDVVLTKDNKPVVALIPIERYVKWLKRDKQDKQDEQNKSNNGE